MLVFVSSISNAHCYRNNKRKRKRQTRTLFICQRLRMMLPSRNTIALIVHYGRYETSMYYDRYVTYGTGILYVVCCQCRIWYVAVVAYAYDSYVKYAHAQCTSFWWVNDKWIMIMIMDLDLDADAGCSVWLCLVLVFRSQGGFILIGYYHDHA